MELAEYIKNKGWDVIFVSPRGDYSEKLSKEGWKYIPLEFSRKGVNPFREYQTIRQIKKIYIKEKPDLVHHFTIKCVIYGSLAAKSVNIKGIINSITGLGYIFLGTSIFAKLIKSIVKKLYQKALTGTEVIFENPDDAELFQKLSLVESTQAHIVLGTGINTNKFIPIPPPDSVPLITLPARMLWDKGISEFVEAASILKKKNIKARFALVGKNDEGNPRSISFDQLTLWQKEGNVEWWGWQDDIIPVFSMSDVICLPSYREGLPKVLIEAAACGRPIVTTDVPGCREVVQDGVNGYLVPVKNAEKLADALEKLILDRELRNSMGIESRKIAVKLFSSDNVNLNIFSIYQKAVSKWN